MEKTPQKEMLDTYGLNLFCSSAELEALKKDDGIIDEFNMMAQAKTSIIMANKTVVERGIDAIFSDWLVLQDGHEIVLLVPPKISNLDEFDFELSTFKQTSLAELHNNPAKLSSGAMAGAVKELLSRRTQHSLPCTIMLSGHGQYKRPDEATHEIIQSGMTLKNLCSTLQFLSDKGITLGIYSCCYGSSKNVLNYISEPGYSFPLISCCLGDNSSFVLKRLNQKAIRECYSLLHECSGTHDSENLFKAFDKILLTNQTIENTPLILWPKAQKFDLLAAANITISDNVTAKSTHDTIFLEDQSIDTLNLSDNKKICLASPYRYNYKIKGLAVKTKDPLEFGKNMRRPREYKKTRKLCIDKLMLHKSVIRNVVITLANQKNSMEYLDDSKVIKFYFKIT